MPISAKDPIGAILSGNRQTRNVSYDGSRNVPWFDFTVESLEWHKQVAKELWDMYGDHPSFYGFYVSEECTGNLYNSESTNEGQMIRKKEIVNFFREFKKYTSQFAPEKPVMLATNSMEVLKGADLIPLYYKISIYYVHLVLHVCQRRPYRKRSSRYFAKFCDDAGALMV